MRKISYLIFSTLIVFSSSLFISCEDDDKDPFVIEENAENFAPYVRFVPSNAAIDVTAIDSGDIVYAGVLDDSADNVASWAVEIRKIRSGDTIPYAPLTSFNSFPAEFELTGQDIADALDIPLSEIQAGDKIEFNAVSTGTDGVELRFEDLGPDLFGQPEQRQAYFFNVFVGCPFVQADAVGTYTTTLDAFGLAAATFEVAPGPDENSVILVDVWQAGLSQVVNVDPNSGIATIERQPAKDDFFGFVGGNINTISTPSFVFACTGTISATLQYTVDLGSFGSFGFGAVKN